MRKRLLPVSLMCGALLSLVACGNYAIPDSTPPAVTVRCRKPV
ncbi:hypothetical protein [Anaerotruncus colihominis]|nr:hypothetical protein [Anaerotruncus colihominis]MCR2025982.1 hypothetical protein [Anaerotruncus colihominis]